MAEKVQAVGDEEPEEGEIQDDDEDGLFEDVSSAEEVPSPKQDINGRNVLHSHKYSISQIAKDCPPHHSVRKSCKRKTRLLPSCTTESKSKLNVTKYRNESNIPSREVRRVRLDSVVKNDSERDKCFEYKNMIVEYKTLGPKSLQDEDVVHEKENRHGCRDTAKNRKENRRKRHRSLQSSDKKSSDSEPDVEKKKKKQANDGVKRKENAAKKAETKSKNYRNRKRSQSPKREKHHALKRKSCKKCLNKKVYKLSSLKPTDSVLVNQENSLLKRLQAMMSISVPNKRDNSALDTDKKDCDIVKEVVNNIVNIACNAVMEKEKNNSNKSVSTEETGLPTGVVILETEHKKEPEVITIDDTDNSSSEADKEILNEIKNQFCSKVDNNDKKEETKLIDSKIHNDEDEDLLQLRTLALQSSRRKEAKKPNKEEDEILQLRLEALRSAVLKKYKDRKQRGHTLRSKQSLLKMGNSDPGKQNDVDDFPFSPPGLLPPSPVQSPNLPAQNEVEPDETTTIVDMDLSNTDDEKEVEMNTRVNDMDDFCKHIPLPDEMSNSSYLGGKKRAVQSSTSKTIIVNNLNEPSEIAWNPLPPFVGTEVNFTYNGCQIPDMCNSSEGNSSNFAISALSHVPPGATYQCQTFNDFYINDNSGLPSADLDGAPLDPSSGPYEMHPLPRPSSTYIQAASFSSDPQHFKSVAASSTERALPYTDREIASTTVTASSKENKIFSPTKSMFVEKIKEAENLCPKPVVVGYCNVQPVDNGNIKCEVGSHSTSEAVNESANVVLEGTNRSTKENEEEEEILRAQLLTALAEKKRKTALHNTVSAEVQPNATQVQKDTPCSVESNLACSNIISEISSSSSTAKPTETYVNQTVAKKSSLTPVTSVANKPTISYGQNKYSRQVSEKKLIMKKVPGVSARQQVLVKNVLKLNKLPNVYKSILSPFANKVNHSASKSWKRSLRTASSLNLKLLTKTNKKSPHLVGNLSGSSTFNIKQRAAVMPMTSNIRTHSLAARNSSARVIFNSNRNNMNSLKVIVPAKTSDSVHSRRTVAESKQDAGTSESAVSRFVIRLGEDSDSGDENDQHRQTTPLSKRRCVLKDGCPVLTVSTKNVQATSNVCRDQQSSTVVPMKIKSIPLLGSASTVSTKNVQATSDVNKVQQSLTVVPLKMKSVPLLGSASTVSTKNVHATSDVNRVQQSSAMVPMKKKSVPLPGSTSADFEKSVDMFLKQARLSQESKGNSGGASLENTGEKQGIAPVTPLAVRHLPSSQQEEYRRLKQQIAELEEQRRQRLKQQLSSKVVQKSNSPCSPNRIVIESNLEISSKTIVINATPEKKQLPQITQIPQKAQNTTAKSIDSVVIAKNSVKNAPTSNKTLPKQNLNTAKRNAESIQKLRETECLKTTKKVEGALNETINLVADPDLGTVPQKNIELSTLNSVNAGIVTECNANLDRCTLSNQRDIDIIAEVTEKKNEVTEVLLQTCVSLEDANEDKLSKLADAELQLLSRRYALLDDLTDMSALLRQVAVEQTIEEECVKEVERLRLKLKRAEEKLAQQHNLIANMRSSMTQSFQKLAKGRLECIKISKICLSLGIAVKGDKYKVPAGGAELMNLKLQQTYAQTCGVSKKIQRDCDDSSVYTDLSIDQEITAHTNSEQSVSGVKHTNLNVPNILQAKSDIEEMVPVSSVESASNTQEKVLDTVDSVFERCSEESSSAIVDPSKNSAECSFKHIKGISNGGLYDNYMDCYEPVLGRENCEERLKLPSSLVEYRSPLEHLKRGKSKIGENGFTIDPHAILCPFELMGSCQDDECSYQHQGR